MNTIKDYTTTEQQNILDQLNALHKDRYDAGYNKYDLANTIHALNRASNLDELEETMSAETKKGVARTLNLYGCVEEKIERTHDDIAYLEKQLIEAKADLVKLEQEKALLEKLEATGFQSILAEMKADRRNELENVEYLYIYKVFKTEQFLNNHRWDMSKKTVVRCELWRVEKGNRTNNEKLYRVFQLDWKDRGRLIDELKAKEAQFVVADPKIVTKKLEKEFNILWTVDSDYNLF